MFKGNVVLDKYFNIVSASPDFFSFVGVQNYDSLLKIVHPEYVDGLKEAVDGLENVKSRDLFLKMKNTHGEFREVYAVLSPSDYISEGVSCFGVEVTDVKNCLKYMKNVTVENLIFRTVLSARGAIVFTYNRKDDILILSSVENNKNFQLFSGALDDFRKFCTDNRIIADRSMDVFNRMCTDLSHYNSFEYKIYAKSFDKSGDYVPIKVAANINYRGNRYFSAFGEITVLDNLGMEAIAPYSKDHMTGLLDRRAIIRYAKESISRAEKTGKKVIIAMVDMDDFKAINDNLGHAVGDSVIIRFARILAKNAGEKGIAGRYGGDEFMVVFSGIEDNPELRSYLRAIRTTVQMEFSNVEGSGFSVSCSIGCAEYPTDGSCYEDVFKLADLCVYIGKEYGKNRYIIYDDRVKSVIKTDDDLWLGRSSRVAVNNDFTFSLTSDLFNRGEKAVPNVLECIGKKYNLSHIVIFLGDDMLPAFVWTKDGVRECDDMNCRYIWDNDYIERFDANNVYKINNIGQLEMRYPMAFDMLKRCKVNSAVQYLIRNDEGVHGLISFEISPPASRYWHSGETNTFIFVSQIMGQMFQRRLHT